MQSKQTFYDQYLSKNPCNYEKYALLDFASTYRRFEHYYAGFLPTDKARIVDLGCGSGAFVSWLQSKGYENVEGIDISQEQIDAGIEHGVKNLKRADVFEYLKDCKEAFALVCAHDLVEHFEKDEILRLLSLIFQALHQGGVLLISTPNAGSLFGQRIMYGDFTHETHLTPASLFQILHFAGFTHVKVFPKEPVIHGVKSLARWTLWKVIKQFIRLYLLIVTGSAGHGCYTPVMYAIGVKKRCEKG